MRAAIKGFLTEEAEREQVEERLIHDPAAGQVIAGTGGFRKLRVALPGGGKSRGGRLVYYFVGRRGRVYLVEFFAKSVKENLKRRERNLLKKMAMELEAEP